MDNVWSAIFVVMVVAALLWTGAAMGESGGASASKPTTSQPASQTVVKIAISKETTFLLGPLRADGTIDYAAAIKEKLTKGVTPDNNAAVLIIKALGPTVIYEKERPARLKSLGLQDLPIKGDYLLIASEFLQIEPSAATTAPASGPLELNLDYDPTSRIVQARDACTTRLWNQDTQPMLAKWLKANEKPLDLLVRASELPKFYYPINSDGESLITDVSIPPVVRLLNGTKMLAISAMMKCDRGDITGAQADVMAIHRLARLIEQYPILLNQLIAFGNDTVACSTEQAIATSGKLTAKQAMDFLTQLDTLPAIGTMPESIDSMGRAFWLETVLAFAAGNQAAKAELKLDPRFYDPLIAKTNLDEVLRRINVLYDLAVIEAKSPLSTEGKAARSQIDKIAESAAKSPLLVELTKKVAAINEADTKLKSIVNIVKSIPSGSQPSADAVAQRIADTINASVAQKSDKEVTELVCNYLESTISSSTLSQLPSVYNLQSAAQMRGGLSRVAFALAAFRANNGKYPTELSALVPTYLKAVPKDSFSGEAIIYKPHGNGYLLYSVGANKKDDGGKYEVLKDDSSPRVDDIAVQAK